MRKLYYLGAIILFLEGCAPIVNPMPTPDGKQGFTVDCTMSPGGIAGCYTKANELCLGKGFIVLDKIDERPTFWSGAKKQLIIGCK